MKQAKELKSSMQHAILVNIAMAKKEKADKIAR